MPDTLSLFGEPLPAAQAPAEPKAAQRVPVWSSSRGLGRCRSCQEPITWFHTVGKEQSIPFNADPVPLRTYLDGDGRRIEELDAADVHFRNCPQASSFRKRR